MPPKGLAYKSEKISPAAGFGGIVCLQGAAVNDDIFAGAVLGVALAGLEANAVVGALHMISANFKKKFSLEEMAKDLGVSKYVLSRLFSKTFHRNFNQYLNDARLNYACHRLENTSDSITNICLDSGFESQRTFNRVFKERYKISPSDYRSTCVKEMLS